MSWRGGRRPGRGPGGAKKTGYRGPCRLCPHCQAPARFVNCRRRKLLSLVGPVALERAYYHCKACGRGSFPLDEELAGAVDGLTRSACEAVCLAGATNPFGKASRTLAKLSGLEVSEATVRRLTERAGRAVGERLAKGETFGPDRDWEWNRDAAGRSCAYVSVDATGVGMQGPRGAKADGRMPYVAMVYNPSAKRDGSESGQSRYLAGLVGLEELGPALRAQAAQVGMERAEQWIALSDGGAGLDAFFEQNFPGAQRILDFWHAAEHLSELAAMLDPADASASTARFEEWRRCLRYEGGRALLKRLLNLYVQDRSAAVQDRHRRLLEYVRSNIHRMDYPSYAAQGWRIGSGPVESACKLVVNARLCQSGMRWSEAGADGVCHLRALYCGEPSQWDAAWADPSFTLVP